MENAAAWIWFQQTFGRGTPRAGQVLTAYGHPGAILGSSRERLCMERVLRPAEIGAVAPAALWEAEELLKRCRQLGDRVLTPDMDDFPQRLLQIPCPPCALFVRGELGEIDGQVAVAIVGSRRASAYGLRAARILAGELAQSGVVIVSGFADGIDEAGHLAALERGGRTVAVLGCGLDADYPRGRGELRARVAAQGAIISEYPPGTQPSPPLFPVRNRIISGLSLGVLVVEGALRSGSLVTAHHALEQGRDVFAVPGEIFSPLSAAPNALLRDGEAQLVTCAADILQEYLPLSADTISIKQATVPLVCPPAPPDGLSGNQQIVYGLLDREPRTTQELIISARLPAKDVLAALTQLEINGAAAAYPGKRYAIASPQDRGKGGAGE